jgi:hypothetical protein
VINDEELSSLEKIVLPERFELGCIINMDPDPGETDFWFARSQFQNVSPKDRAITYVTACNNVLKVFPSLIQTLHALKDVARYARHNSDCPIDPCNCGLTEALKKIE